MEIRNLLVEGGDILTKNFLQKNYLMNFICLEVEKIYLKTKNMLILLLSDFK